MISCSCDDYDGGTTTVGEARIVTCRTPRKCSDCSAQIVAGDTMYVQSFFNWEEMKAVPPYYMCERCGDLIESLAAAHYCFPYGDVLGQWREYLEERKAH